MGGEKCAIVILNYNDSETTLDLAERVKSYGVLDYILIVDNCSTDDSWKRIERIDEDKIVKLRLDNNGGYGAGNNAGVRYANEQLGCKYALIANPDVSFEESVLIAMLDKMKSNSDIAVASPVQLDRNHQIIQSVAWKIPTVFQYIVSAERIAREFLGTFYYGRALLEQGDFANVECVPGSLLLVDTDVFMNIGGYDEDMFLYCEETVLGHKVKQAGYRTVLLTKERYVHLHSVSISKSIASERRRQKLLLKSRKLFLSRYLKASKLSLMCADIVYWIADKEVFLLPKNR